MYGDDCMKCSFPQCAGSVYKYYRRVVLNEYFQNINIEPLYVGLCDSCSLEHTNGEYVISTEVTEEEYIVNKIISS